MYYIYYIPIHVYILHFTYSLVKGVSYGKLYRYRIYYICLIHECVLFSRTIWSRVGLTFLNVEPFVCIMASIYCINYCIRSIRLVILQFIKPIIKSRKNKNNNLLIERQARRRKENKHWRYNIYVEYRTRSIRVADSSYIDLYRHTAIQWHGEFLL